MRTLLLSLAIAFFSCHTTGKNDRADNSAPDASALYGKEWQLTELEGQPIDSSKTAQIPSLQFLADGSRVAGNAGCNRMMGSFTLSGVNSLSFSSLASTEMACPHMKLEGRYMAALQRINRYGIIDGKLLLLEGEKVVAQFSPK